MRKGTRFLVIRIAAISVSAAMETDVIDYDAYGRPYTDDNVHNSRLTVQQLCVRSYVRCKKGKGAYSC